MMNESHRAAKIVLILGTVIGLSMVVITPPFQVPDEDAHFFRAYQTSILNLRLERRGDRVGAELPRCYRDTQLLFRGITVDRTSRVNAPMYKQALSMTDSSPVFSSPILPYPPVAYVAQAIGLFAGRSANAPPIVSFYLARLLNLALFLFMTTWAIRLMPVMPWGLALLTLMPMTMFQGSSVSADAFTIGLSFLVIAFLLRCAIHDQRLTARHIVFMFGGAVLLSLAKQGYSPIIFLALVIPFDRFGTRMRKAIVIAGLFIVTAAIGIVCLFAIRDYSVGLPGSNSAEQLRLILAHPLAYVYKLAVSPFRSFCIESFIGWLGWLDTRLPKWILIPYSLLLIAVPFAEGRASNLTRRQRWIAGGLFVLLGSIIFTVQYLSWNAVGRKIIDGVQGRYLIPFSPLLLLQFNNRRISFSIEEHPTARRMLIGFIILVHVVTAVTLIKRYYPLL
jgi:uncharacterized membrane protein